MWFYINNAQSIIGFCKHFMSESLGLKIWISKRGRRLPSQCLPDSRARLTKASTNQLVLVVPIEGRLDLVHVADASSTASPCWTGLKLIQLKSRWFPSSPRTSGAGGSIKVRFFYSFLIVLGLGRKREWGGNRVRANSVGLGNPWKKTGGCTSTSVPHQCTTLVHHTSAPWIRNSQKCGRQTRLDFTEQEMKLFQIFCHFKLQRYPCCIVHWL